MNSTHPHRNERLFIKSLLVFCYLVCVTSCHNSGRYMPSTVITEDIMFLEVADEEEKEKVYNTEEYDVLKENDYRATLTDPLSTFSIDVDKASYANVRRFLNQSQLPPPGSIRIEELVNYFDYQYPEPGGEHPFSISTELTECPWNENHHLFRIGLKGRSMTEGTQLKSNLVFLIDVSGSMEEENKLPLVKKSLKILVDHLSEADRVSIVVYAGAAGLVLPSTGIDEKNKIEKAIEKLSAGGSTAGGEGLQLAFKIAEDNFIEGGNNRIILATDGDFNVGISSTAAMVQLVREKRQAGIYLTICGFGMGNYKDYRMEEISNNANGNYFYIDSILEANKVFGEELTANMFAIARDVKIQIEFNPGRVKEYRLIGYENRMLETKDFSDDKKDAGELGAGHTVTALYELVPVGSEGETREDDLKYQSTEVIESDELAVVKLRYKPLDSDVSALIERVVDQQPIPFADGSDDMRFSSSVASFGMLLINSEYRGSATYNGVLDVAKKAVGKDPYQYRSEFLSLVQKAKLLSSQP